MDKQEKKLISSLVLLVESLRTPETLVPVLKDLGARHKSPTRIIALQDLNEDGVTLNNLDLPEAKLVRINLPKADLSEAIIIKS